MKFKIFIVSVILVCSLQPDICLAQNKVVVIPLFSDGSTCAGTLVGTRWCDNGDSTVTDMTTGLVWLKFADWGGLKPWRSNTSGDYDDARDQDRSFAGWRCGTFPAAARLQCSFKRRFCCGGLAVTCVAGVFSFN